MGFILTILTIVAVIYLLRLLFPFLLLWLIRRQQRQMGKQFFGGEWEQQSGKQGGAQWGQNSQRQQWRGGNQRSQKRSSRNSGDVRVEYTAPKEKQVSKDVGESVEFEEIKN